MIKTFILEEHNEAFLVWNYLRIKEGNFSKSTLLHIDHHSDLSAPLLKSRLNINESDLNFINRMTKNEISISSFIVPSIYMGFFNKVMWIKGVTIDGYKTLHKQINVEKRENTFFYLLEKSVDEADIPLDIIIGGLNSADELLNYESTFVLDIDLDFFSCNENPFLTKKTEIQIAESEYNKFNTNKYHYFRYLFPNFSIQAIRKNGSFYYVLNDFEDEISSKHKVSISAAKNKIDCLIKMLKKTNNKPMAITISKSVKSGYTPFDQASYILAYLLESLSSIYELETIKINYLEERFCQF